MKDIVICRTHSQLLSYLRRNGYRTHPTRIVGDWEVDADVVHNGEKVYYLITSINSDGWVETVRKLVCLYRPRKQ
jgi:hypothetical protein